MVAFQLHDKIHGIGLQGIEDGLMLVYGIGEDVVEKIADHPYAVIVSAYGNHGVKDFLMAAGLEQQAVHGVVQFHEGYGIPAGKRGFLLSYDIFHLRKKLQADSLVKGLLYGAQFQVQSAESFVTDLGHVYQCNGGSALRADLHKAFVFKVLEGIADG